MKYSPSDVITKKFGNTEIEILKEQGAIITSLLINGEQILYQGMSDTFWDDEKSIRWGIPFLFPQAGSLTEDEQKQLGYTMPQHGTARKSVWQKSDETENSLSFEFDSNSQTYDIKIPYNFRVEVKYSLDEKWISIDYTFENRNEKPFAISPGIHPYFRIPQGDKNALQWQKEFEKQIIEESDIWQQNGTTFLDTKAIEKFNFTIPDVGTLEVGFDENTKNLWIWSMKYKDFVCVEPVTGNPGNIVREPIVIEANSTHKIHYHIRLK